MNYTEFISKLITRLLANDFLPVNKPENYTITESTNYALFQKPGQRNITLVNFINCETFDKQYYISVKQNLETNLTNFFETKQVQNVFCVDLFIGDNYEVDDLIKNAPPYDGEFIFNILWKVSLTDKLIVASKSQPSKINNIEKYISETFNDNSDIEDLSLDNLEVISKKNSELIALNDSVVLTYIFIVINLLIYTIMSMQSKSLNVDSNVLYNFGALTRINVTHLHEFWRLVTPIFLHITFHHLAYNCLAIYIFGSRVEKYFGKLNFLSLYLFTGIVGNILTVAFSSYSLSAGASGSIYGLIGTVGSITFFTKKKLDGFSSMGIFIFIVVGLISDYYTPNVGSLAHIGGLISGLCLGSIFTLFKDR